MSKLGTGQRNVYLNLKTRDEALKIFLGRVKLTDRRESESLNLNDAHGRVTASPVFARFSSPSFHASAMDGIAVFSDDTFGASEDRPKELELGLTAIPVNTGNPLPKGTNAVIMIEQVEELANNRVRIEAAAFPWQHVRKVGEDIVATEMVLAQNTELSAYELGALAASGHSSVMVRKKPLVHIIPTGSELLSLDSLDGEPEPGSLVEYNSVLLAALAKEAGGEGFVNDIVPDDFDLIVEALDKAAQGPADLVIINAGSSAGSEDYTAAAINELGEVLVHGVTIMPGKPTILGVVYGKPVIGNPGYPVSAVISFEQFAMPVISGILGVIKKERQKLKVTPAQAIPSKLGLEEFLRVKLGRINDAIVAVPLPRGAGSITTLTQADGIIRIPETSEGIGNEEAVEAELIRTVKEIEGTLVAIGSHDNTLDILGDLMREKDYRVSLSSGNVGSLGGILALKRGHSHFCGTHLLDIETGEYNVSYIKKYLQGMPCRLLNLVTREQGFILPKGNPKGIRDFSDLTREDIIFINRQAGSGTRILFDYNLQKLNIDPDSINGYDHDEYTHMSLAVDVLSGRADAGLGILAAAKALNLDFLPVATESYDLVIPEAFIEDQKIQVMLEVISSPVFKEAVLKLGGYGVERTGEILMKWDGAEIGDDNE